jgi:SET domain
MFTQYLKVAKSKIGEGLFTTIEIPTDVPIEEPHGKIYTAQEMPDPSDANVLQVGPNDYLNISGSLRYINHSCDPNCRFSVVGNRAVLYSLYVIPANAELTFDYSTTSTDTHETWKMNCICGSHKCRKVISGYQYLDPSLQEEYKKKGAIPLFITFPVFQKR